MRDRVGLLGAGDQVAPAQIDAVDAEIGRHQVEHSLQEEIRLEAPRPAIGADRRLVGHPEVRVDLDVRHAIRPGQELADVARADRAVGAHVGAHVVVDGAAQRQDGAVARAGDLDVGRGLARVVHRHQILAPVLGPLHRAVDEARRERDQEIFRVELAARAVAAADVVLDHLDRLDRQADLTGQNPPVEERHLGGARDGELALGGVPLRHHAARFERQSVVPAGAELFAALIRRVAEGRVGVALACLEDERAVGAGCLEQQASVLARRLPLRHRRQRLDLERDRFESVLAGCNARRQHHRDRLADITHLVVRQHRLLVGLELRQRLQPHRNDRRSARHVGRRDDSLHAGAALCGRHVERDDTPVRHLAAQDHRIQQSLDGEIVQIFAAPAQEAQVLAALHRRADVGISHERPLL